MPETYGMPSLGSNFIARWVAQEAAERDPDTYGSPTVAVDDESVPEPIAGSRRSRVTADKIARVIAEATGQDPEDLELDFTDMDAVADVITHDLTDPQSAWDALDVALSERRLTQGHPDEPATEEEVRQTERIIERIDGLTEPPTRKRGESSRAYVLRERRWREERGLPPKKKKPSPNRSPERRRLERMRAKARKFGISVEEADAMTPRDPRVRAMSIPQEASPHDIVNPNPDR